MQGTHGAAIVREFGRGFTSNGCSNSVTIFDLHSLATIREVKLQAARPDGYLYMFNREEKTHTAKMKHSRLSTAWLRFLFLAAKI